MIINSNGHVEGLKRPSDEVYNRLWWWDLEGMTFGMLVNSIFFTQESSHFSAVFIRHANRDKMVLEVRKPPTIVLKTFVFKATYKDKKFLHLADGIGNSVEIKWNC